MEKFNILSALKKQLQLIKEANMRYLYICYVISALFGGMIPIISVFYAKLIIDVIQGSKDQQELIMRVIVLTVTSIICFSVKTMVGGYAESKYIRLRQNEFNRCAMFYHEVDYKYIEDSRFQDHVNVGFQALESDGVGFQHVYHMLGILAADFISIIIFFILISQFSIWIGIICVLATVMITWINRSISNYAHLREDDKAKAFRQSYYFNNTCSDFTYGKDIRVFELKFPLLKIYQDKSKQYIRVIREIEDKKLRIGLMELAVLLIQDVLSYYLIVQGFFNGRLDLASVSLYLSAVVGFTTIMRTFSENLSIMLTDLKLSSTYFEMITDQSYYSEDQGRNALDEEIPIEIEFKNVSFRYPNTERYILKDFNFKIHAKEKLAIVGTNGAGKTTIVKLICGLFEPESGEILINGISMKEFCKQEYYKMFSAVFQDFEIYAGTILENVIGNDIDESSKKRGKMCLNRVGLKEKIESLPSGYDTPLVKSIDPEGVDLSGGQKQKIAIARALYKNGNVVILDEPTSALDALAEADIYQSFDDLVSNKTAIYISHRLSSTKFCDKIAFFDENGLQEYGTHEELMALKKGYYHMFEVQGQYYQEGVEKDGRKECFA